MGKAKFERNKPHVNVGTIGHVDHGKTTLTAALTKISSDKGYGTKYVSYDQVAKASESQEVGAEWRIAAACGRRIVGVMLDDTKLPAEAATVQAVDWR